MMIRNHTIGMALATALMLVLFDRGAVAYNPPVDEAGPLSVTIEGPDEVTATGEGLPVKVVLENSGNQQIAGSLRLAVIDHWRIDPAGLVPFQVAGNDRETLRFTATAGEGTYSAHYPIHAYANFEADGQEFTAHPILILETKLPSDAHKGPRVPFEPIAMAPNSELALWRVIAHRSVVAPEGRKARTMPVGWQGSEPLTGGTPARRRPRQRGRCPAPTSARRRLSACRWS
ncbi:MAG: hypothetical protein R6U98_11275 [Pirellulaceae bacterium]